MKRDQTIYNVSAVESIYVSPRGPQKSNKIEETELLKLNYDATQRSDIFPPSMPIRATELGLPNFSNKILRKERVKRVLAHLTR